jgi:diaminohydroxyphosphoribosylaminopyrimidine deaminase / 5-amino-6-(5-phosphoribosylamino)uracil reductase
MPTFSEFDHRAMARAVELAWRGVNTTHPNPNVGCVIAKDGEIIAEGWHERAGGPHAEAMALRALASGAGLAAANGATVYVTLEPCSHHGRTPPCAEALVNAKVGRVVCSIVDPNPRVAGGGTALLRQADIKVEMGLMAAEAEELNLGFLKRMRKGAPYVRVKVGMSLDGRTALANGKSKWITSDAAREDVQRWRARSSAVLTGIGTVLADDPQLNVRLPDVARQPMIVVLDANARVQPGAKLFTGGGPVVVFTKNSSLPAAAALRQNGVRVEVVTGGDQLDLKAVLLKLGELEVNDVLVEAGPTLTGALVRDGVADELLIYMAPKLLGPQARPLFDLPQLEDLQQAASFHIIETAQVGPDLRLRMRPT